MNRQILKIGIYVMALGLALSSCQAPTPESKERKATFTHEGLTPEERDAGVMTPEVMWKMGRVGGMSLSPDGSRVVYTVSYFNVADNNSQTSIYIQGTGEAEGTLLVEKGGAPQWHPSGDKIGFLRAVDGVSQLFEISISGGSAVQITAGKSDIESFWYAPDGTKLLFASRVQVEPSTEDYYPGMREANVRIIDSLMYRHWNYWVEGKYSHLFLADYNGEGISGARDLMEGEAWDCPMAPYFDPSEVTWAPDSKSFFYTCKKSTGKEYALSTNSNIYRFDIARGTSEMLTEGNPGYDKTPVVSPDGAKLLWQRMRTPGYESDLARLMCMDLATGRTEELMEAYDQNADAYGWMPGGQAIYVISALKGTSQLFSLDMETKALTQLTDGQWDVNWAVPIEEGWLIHRTQLNKPAELYTYKNGEFKNFTEVNRAFYESIKFSEVRARWIKTTDGGSMLTWIVLPPDFDSTKRYPALLYCQGGPQSTVSQFWSYRWNIQLMASQGYVVVCPNRHGVPSFGQAWNLQISGDYSGQNIKDYLTAIDEVAKEPWVDEAHLGAVGASYGGYSVYYLAGVHEGRFKAFIAHNGMFNFESFYAATEETFFPQHDLGGAYWEQGNAVAQRSFANSPHRNVAKWDTPILIIVGENDFRIPYTEGLQAFNAAQLLGVPSRLLVYPEETHFVTQPQNSIIWQHEFFNWLDRWLKPEK